MFKEVKGITNTGTREAEGVFGENALIELGREK